VVTLVLVIIFLAPLAVNIPLAVLAAILFMVAWNMSEAHHFLTMLKRAPKADIFILLITFALTVFVDLVVAVNIGVILAVLHFLRRMAASVEVQQVSEDELREGLGSTQVNRVPEGVLVYVIDGPFFFAAVENFQLALASTHTDPRALIIRLRWVPFIDITALRSLEESILDLHKRKVKVMLSGASDRVRAKLERAGITKLIGKDNMVLTLADAIKTCESL
jgi:SulP family sulfate permease